MHVGTRLIACLERLAVPMLCLLDLAELRAGHSGDAVWDALQLFLVQNGELHNNARMGWGKAILKWTAGPAECMETLMDLNNRFALDGHSPPSMAGLLGCMGLFETPRGERSVTGSVGMRSLKPRYLALKPDPSRSLKDPWQELSDEQKAQMAAALGVDL
eukprot:COSAG02_NODE_1079_length_14711_cov_86.326512_10_plen_160_part_00